MTPTETAKRLAWYEKHKDVMKAHAMGAAIEMKRIQDDKWVWATPSWDTAIEYRVKPEPLVLYVNLHQNGHFSGLRFEEQERERILTMNNPIVRTVKLVEQL